MESSAVVPTRYSLLILSMASDTFLGLDSNTGSGSSNAARTPTSSVFGNKIAMPPVVVASDEQARRA